MRKTDTEAQPAGKAAAIAWLEQRLATARRRHNLTVTLSFAATMLSLGVAGLFIYGLFDYLVRFPSGVRLLLTACILVAAILLTRRGFSRRVHLLNTHDEVVRRVEQVKADAGQSQRSLLVGALEFGQRPHIRGSETLKDETIRLARERCVNPGAVPLYDARLVRVACLLLGMTILVSVVAIRAREITSVFLVRLIGSNAAYPTATVLVDIRWQPHAPMRVDYPVTVRLGGELPTAGKLLIDGANQHTFALPLERDQADPELYRAIVPTPLDSFRFRFQAGDFKSDSYAVTVLPPPMVGAATIAIVPPAYTGLPDRETGLDSVEVPEGSRLTFRVQPTRPVVQCVLELGATNRIMDAVDNGYATTIDATESGPFRIRLEDKLGVANVDAARYYLAVQPDSAPVVMIDVPRGDTFRSNLSRVEVAVAARDDFAITALALEYTVHRPLPAKSGEDENQAKVVHRGVIEMTAGGIGSAETVNRSSMLVNTFKAEPADRVVLQAVARDNCAGEPKEGRSNEVSLFVVTPDEMRTLIGQTQDQVLQLLAKLRDDEKRQMEAVKERLAP